MAAQMIRLPQHIKGSRGIEEASIHKRVLHQQTLYVHDCLPASAGWP